jgi:hypothetical protein
MGFAPKQARHAKRINPLTSPPCGFIAAAMEFAVVQAAHRNGEFVAHFARQSAALCETEMMRVRRLPAAHQARYSGDRPDSVANPTGLGQREYALVDSR